MLSAPLNPLNVEMAATAPAASMHEFTALEQDCKTQLQAVSRRIAELGNYSAVPGNPDRSHIFDEAQRVLASAQRCIDDMRTMVPKLEQSERHKANAKLRGITNEATKLTNGLADTQPSSQRSELFAGSSSTSNNQRQPSSSEQAFAESAARTSRIINDTFNTVVETEEIGSNVIGDLHGQRQILLGAHEKVKETNSMVDQARVVMRRMACRAIYNKAFLWGILVLEVLCIGLVLYYGYIKKSN